MFEHSAPALAKAAAGVDNKKVGARAAAPGPLAFGAAPLRPAPAETREVNQMLCVRCKKRTAVVFIQRMENGKPIQEGYCLTCAKALHIPTLTGCIASGDQFVANPGRKTYITDTFSAIACEMEGAAIGQVCYVNHIPFCVLRAISDSADGSSHMDYPVFAKMAADQSVRLLLAYLNE